MCHAVQDDFRAQRVGPPTTFHSDKKVVHHSRVRAAAGIDLDQDRTESKQVARSRLPLMALWSAARLGPGRVG